MTDREMLELAARAAGIDLEWDGDPDKWQPMYYEGKTYHEWNPLTDDGDALRLAVKLDIQLWRRSGGRVEGVHSRSVLTSPQAESLMPCPYAATRRAIVRAAAEIGKATPW